MSTLLEQASLVLIPSGYKEDVVYSQIPTDGSGDLSFTRASNGTRINSAGLVEVCPWNEAQQSNTFGTSPWSNTLDTGATLTYTANYGTAPDGTATAGRLQMALNGSNYAQKNQIISVVTGQQYTYSVWIKSLSGTKSVIFCYDNTNNITASVTTEWQRFTHTFTGNSQVYARFVLEAGTSTSVDLLIYGAQLNIGSTAKPYFPTTDRLNVPRLTYQNGGGGCPSLLLEKQSTNYSKWSNDLTQSSAWIDQSTNTTITQITSGGPDGGSFTRLVSTGSGSQGRIVQAGSITNPNGATMSVYLKGSGDTAFGLFIGNGISQYQQITLTNTWTRYVVSVSGVGATYQDWQISCVGGSTIDVSFVQIEEGVYATSPIPTTSSSATRVADACFKTGISSLIGQSEGTMFVDVDLTHTNLSGINEYLMQLYMDAGARVILFRNSASQLNYYFLKGAISFYSNTSISSNGRHKLAFAYKSGDSAFYVDGVQIETNATTFSAFSSLSELHLGANYNPTQAENGDYEYNEAIVFPTRLTNAELASLTTI
jgi:hypothetical protein